VTTDTVREACRRHDLLGAEAIILGRLLTAATLLATLTKQDQERVRIEVRGNGPLGRALADAHGDGTVRGCLVTRLPSPAMPGHSGGRDTIGDLVGRGGMLAITRDLGLEQPYQGVVNLETGELDADIERYLAASEQLPSALRCTVCLDSDGTVIRAAGILCQTFPDTDGERLDPIRDNLADAALGDVLSHDRTAEDLMGFALLGEEFRPMRSTTVRFHCDCGRKRALAVVSTLGAEDIDSLADEKGGTEVTCTYCGSEYELTADDLRGLAAQLRQHRS
jgi:molecular chaperone Hsp33